MHIVYSIYNVIAFPSQTNCRHDAIKVLLNFNLVVSCTEVLELPEKEYKQKHHQTPSQFVFRNRISVNGIHIV